jgi:hypothetical protein
MNNIDSLLNLDQVSNDLENGGFESLLVERENSINASSETQEGSLLSSDDTMSFVELNNDAMSEHEIEIRRKFFSDPKNQAQILLDNYIKNQTILVNHSQRRKIYAEFLRNAKKGKYKRIFSEYINGMSKEDSQKKFSKLNG